MTDVYIFDSVRTPRGKGKKDGSLHEVKPIDLGVTVLEALRERNGFDPAQVDDIVMGVVSPIGDRARCCRRLPPSKPAGMCVARAYRSIGFVRRV